MGGHLSPKPSGPPARALTEHNVQGQVWTVPARPRPDEDDDMLSIIIVHEIPL